ncbi:signal peptide peptidase SppA [Archangium sp.]|uniref:signal peptide peptidase SppA n=1 Tax=Archangium sp. TaxID=1872627 RepID=UPI003899A320
MRFLVLPLINLLLLVRHLLGLPFRLLGARSRPAYIRFRLTGDPPYREQPRPRSLPFLGGQGRPEPATVTSLEGFRKALELLAGDAQVKGILVELEDLAVPPAKRDVLVKLLGDFRAAGKRVVAWAVGTDNLGYQVMCAADEALLSPAGRLDLLGYAAEAVAVGEGLEKLGVRAHFFRRGEYKTAPELFTLPHVSSIQRQVLESFLDERYVELVDQLARGRKRTPEQARAWIDEGPYTARRALAAGLIDGVCDEADLPARLAGKGAEAKDAAEAKGKEAKDEEDEGLEPMPGYLAMLPWPPVRWRPLRPRPRLGVVPLSGMIVSGKGGSGVAGPELAGSDTVVKALRAAGRSRRVKAVLLYVSSSGGSAVASEIILEAVQRVAKKKPVIAFVDRVAASGGYMAALGAREIWATPHAIVGSIGVFVGKFDTSGLLEKLGVHRTLITRGENAGLYSSTRGFTEHERALMDAEVEETYQAFLGHVAKARGRTKEEIHALGEGRVFSGTRALAAGLVDRTEGFEEACRRAMELAKVPGRFELQVYGGEGRRFSLLKLLLGGSHAATYAFCPTAWNLEGFGRGERFE